MLNKPFSYVKAFRTGKIMSVFAFLFVFICGGVKSFCALKSHDSPKTTWIKWHFIYRYMLYLF